ncbi:hypothetical protein P3X46_007058 [Hevea brasiliensis]|uniref:non-specific serine/threonine protein kinase n=1 Tax=Hevea brasiliensis TaxID=3981 RepID=A0ABQ9MUU6_HEVBR|nr:hypothetical protein P3X46_007058 [Hevea brasiliensis]
MTCGISEKSLYKTARLCPVALTYYAFCLHQGKYDVTLHFAETVYAKEEDYSSQGKRVFDVYIQIHLYWAGKGSLYNPPALNGPLLSAISVIPSNHNKKLSPVKITGFTLGSAFTFLLVLFVMRKMGWLGKNELDEKIIQVEDKKFTLRQIINATRNFNPRMVIGEDRFGKLYKAKLPNQIKLTVKKISPELKQQEKVELQKEITNLLSLRHDNLVKLLDGYSKKNLHLLIYEDLEKPSLHHNLFGNYQILNIFMYYYNVNLLYVFR